MVLIQLRICLVTRINFHFIFILIWWLTNLVTHQIRQEQWICSLHNYWWASQVPNFSLNPNCLELDLKFGSKFRKFAELNFRSTSKFNRSYFGSNLFEPQDFQGWNSLESQPNFGIAISDWPRLSSLMITPTIGSLFIHLKPNNGLPNCLTASNIIHTIPFSGMSVTNKANSLGGGTPFS